MANPPVAIDPIFHDTIKAIALTSVNQEEDKAAELRVEAIQREAVVENEAKAAEAAVLGAVVENDPTVEFWEGGLRKGRRVEVSFGTGYREGNRQEWNSGVLERNVSSDLHLWDIRFDEGINQTIALTSETKGREWRLQEQPEEDEEEDTQFGGSGNNPLTRCREDLPDVLQVGQRIEAKYKRSARFFLGMITAVHDADSYSVCFDDGDFDSSVPRVNIRGLKTEYQMKKEEYNRLKREAEWEKQEKQERDRQRRAKREAEKKEREDWESRNNAFLTGTGKHQLAVGTRVEVLYGEEWVAGTLEGQKDYDFRCWDILFDDNITQPMALMQESRGKEWRFEGEGPKVKKKKTKKQAQPASQVTAVADDEPEQDPNKRKKKASWRTQDAMDQESERQQGSTAYGKKQVKEKQSKQRDPKPKKKGKRKAPDDPYEWVELEEKDQDEPDAGDKIIYLLDGRFEGGSITRPHKSLGWFNVKMDLGNKLVLLLTRENKGEVWQFGSMKEGWRQAYGEDEEAEEEDTVSSRKRQRPPLLDVADETHSTQVYDKNDLWGGRTPSSSARSGSRIGWDLERCRLQGCRQNIKACKDLIQKLLKHQFGWVFAKPVDPVALNLPDYLNVVKKPMDLGTIQSKLAEDSYLTVRDFVKDVRLVWANAMLFNKSETETHQMAKSLEADFELSLKQQQLEGPPSESFLYRCAFNGDNGPRNLKLCEDLVSKFVKHKFGWIFAKAVDPVALNLPNYFEVIKDPMDLGTIQSKLAKNSYSTVRDFVKDVRLVWANAMLFNKAGTSVHANAALLQKEFDTELGRARIAISTVAGEAEEQGADQDESAELEQGARRKRVKRARPKEDESASAGSCGRTLQKRKKKVVEEEEQEQGQEEEEQQFSRSGRKRKLSARAAEASDAEKFQRKQIVVTATTAPPTKRQLKKGAKVRLPRDEWEANLPKGWRVEEVLRRTGQSAGAIDKYYYAPDGRRFRSRNQVERFLFDQRGSVSSLGGKKEISKRELEGTDQAGDGGGDAMEAVETAAPDGLGISITEGIQGTDQSQAQASDDGPSTASLSSAEQKLLREKPQFEDDGKNWQVHSGAYDKAAGCWVVYYHEVGIIASSLHDCEYSSLQEVKKWVESSAPQHEEEKMKHEEVKHEDQQQHEEVKQAAEEQVVPVVSPVVAVAPVVAAPLPASSAGEQQEQHASVREESV